MWRTVEDVILNKKGKGQREESYFEIVITENKGVDTTGSANPGSDQGIERIKFKRFVVQWTKKHTMVHSTLRKDQTGL